MLTAAAGVLLATAPSYPAPAVPNANALKSQHGGESITFIGDSVGGGHTRDVALVNPYLKPEIANVARVARPSNALGAKYNEGSKYIYQGISQILNGKSASSVLPSIQSRLQPLVR
jgi:hypothetical protein